jgi:hypothetical protein
MKKMKFGKFGILTLGIAIVSMLIFSLPLMGATADTTTTEDNTAVEETSVVEDLDDVQEEVEEIGENGDLDEADEAEEASDASEADENLPGGGHEDADGVDAQHEFEGIE